MFKKISSALRTRKTFTQSLRHCEFVCNRAMPVYPATKTSVTSNGIRVATEESTCPMACVSMIAEVGPRYETVNNNGMAHFIEHMAFKGFKTMNRCAIEHDFHMMGVKIDIKTHREFQIFTARCLPQYVNSVLDVFARVVTELELSDHEMELEKHNLCLEMVDADNDHRTVLFDYLHQTAFQGTPLMQRVIGSSKNIRNFDKDNLRVYVCENYQPYRLIIASSGNLSHEQMVASVTDRFGNIIPERCFEVDPGHARFTGSEVRYRDDSLPFCHVAIAVEAPGYTSPEYLTFLVATSILGSWDRSQIGQNKPAPALARAGSISDLCQSYETFYIAYRDIGLFGVYFVSSCMQLEDMLYNVQNEWMKMATMAVYTDAERGINSAKLKIARRADGCVRSSYDIGMQMLYACCRSTVPQIFDGLESVKSHAIREIFDKYIYDRCPAVAAVGPCENLPEYNRIRGGMYWLRL